MNHIKEEILMHYGVAKRSGRYPWGSGDNPYQHSGDFLSRVEELKKSGMKETDIAKSLGLTTSQMRTQVSLAKDERRSINVATAKALREKGYSLNAIAEQMGYANDSSVRTLLNEHTEAKMNASKTTADFLREKVNEKGMIDVGVGVEREIGISREKMKEALYILELEGYEVYGVGVPQVTNPGKQTNIQVLCPPGTEYKEVYNFGEIHSLHNYTSHDDGETFDTYTYPKSMDSNRIQVRYAEEGGLNKDGVVELRRGVDDLSLGNSHYSQVRILVDDNKYIKGMAVYSDNIPDGVDLIFNTNKKQGTPVGEVLKDIKSDPDNPFGSLIKAGGQSYYIDANGERQLSLINKRADEGDWNDWSDKLPSQFLSKQNISLAKRQLDLTTADKRAEFDEIMNLTNPTVKKHLLSSFSDDCDAAAEHLKAAALPRQKYQVILPINSLKDGEVYAPNFKDGEQIALIRYPHGGTFEIPILTVNNKNKEGKNVLGNTPKDAIGITSKVADRLSGADFDGDTVMAIPTGKKVNISSTPPLKGLEGFDPKLEYTHRPGMKVMKNTQTEMGKISNLITDMTLKGANQNELARAVRHSMVVIDAEKHKLDYKQSEQDNGISSLKKKYQGHTDSDGKYHEGASTLISRAKSETQILKRVGSPKINPITGELEYKQVKEEYTDSKGKTKVRTTNVTKMANTNDAFTLVSETNTPSEKLYATYANNMKSLANQARKEILSTGKISYSKKAKEEYSEEVGSLTSKLNVSLKNAPKERQAQIIANATIKSKTQDNPDMTKSEIKKAKQQALNSARISIGAKRELIEITNKEWEAIQSGAISETKLKQILTNTDVDKVREFATPRKTNTISESKVNKINAMRNSGYTTSEIAEAIGVSSSTIIKYIE